jgi:hypothetical protein
VPRSGWFVKRLKDSKRERMSGGSFGLFATFSRYSTLI